MTDSAHAPHLTGINPLPSGALQGLAGTDREGMPALGDLARAEQTTLRRFSPRRKVWTAVAQFDDRVAALEARKTETGAELARLHDKRVSAPAAHADALAQWQLDGEKGTPPESELRDIDDRIAQAQASLAGFDRAIETVLTGKTEYVERHREKLTREAARLTRDAHARLRELIDQLAHARDDVVGLREAGLWVEMHPHPEANRAPQFSLACGGLRQPLREAGVTEQVHIDRLLGLLRSDSDWLLGACTVEQRQLLLGDNADHSADGTATWGGSTEAVERERAEKQAAIAHHVNKFGTRP